MGVCTDVCVLHTVADAFFQGYRVEVPEACVASFSEENHRFGMEHLRTALGAKEPDATPPLPLGEGVLRLAPKEL